MRKAKKKKTAKSNKSGKVESEKEPLGDDDDGTISVADCREISRLIISARKKQLQKTAADFLEVFHGRFMLSIGLSLQTYYQVLVELDVKHDDQLVIYRLVLLYLIYRSIDLEPVLKRKPDKFHNMIGHPFTEFILSVVVSDAAKVYRSKSEEQLATMICCGMGPELGDMVPEDALEKLSQIDMNDGEREAALADVKNYVDACMEDRPEEGRFNVDEPIFIRNPLYDTPTAIDPSALTEDVLCGIGVKLLCEPIADDFVFPQNLLSILDLLPITPSTEREVAHSCAIKGWHMGDLGEEEEPGRCCCGREKGKEGEHHHTLDTQSSRSAAESDEADSDVFSRTGAGEDGLDEVKMCVEKILRGTALSLTEQRSMVKFVNQKPMDVPYMRMLCDMPVATYSRLLEKDFKVALEIARRAVAADRSKLTRYMSVCMGMEISVHCMELIRLIYTDHPDLDDSPLREYIVYVMESCERSEISLSQQIRQVRLVCVFITTLIKLRLFRTRELFTSIQQFVVKFNQHRESTLLYQVLAEEHSHC